MVSITGQTKEEAVREMCENSKGSVEDIKADEKVIYGLDEEDMALYNATIKAAAEAAYWKKQLVKLRDDMWASIARKSGMGANASMRRQEGNLVIVAATDEEVVRGQIAEMISRMD